MTTAVVTGAGGGIGAAIAERLVKEGVTVAINDIDEGKCKLMAAKIGALAVPGDASTEDGVSSLIARSLHDLGTIDIYFANAGIDVHGGLDASDVDWIRSLEVNLLAHVRAARLLFPLWLDGSRGRFVVTASAAGLLTMIGSAAYSASKHAAVAFAEWLSITYGDRGVVVQAICPQGVMTEMLDDATVEQQAILGEQAIEPSVVADVVWEAMQDDRFLILPHPKVATYYSRRGGDTERWLRGMRKIQSRLHAG